MKRDVCDRGDIEKIVSLFYKRVRSDKDIAFFFSHLASMDWERHLSLMSSFWENVLFYTGNYEGDPLITHKRIQQRTPTQPIHFETWLRLFFAAVDQVFEGDNAEKMKNHARAIAQVLQIRMKNNQSALHR